MVSGSELNLAFANTYTPLTAWPRQSSSLFRCLIPIRIIHGTALFLHHLISITVNAAGESLPETNSLNRFLRLLYFPLWSEVEFIVELIKYVPDE